MQLAHDYRYTLHIDNTDEDSLNHFFDAFEATNLIDYMDQEPEDLKRFSSDIVQGNGGLDEVQIMKDLNTLSLQFPKLTLHFTAQDLMDRSYGFELKFENGMVQRAEQLLKRSAFTPPVPYDDFIQVQHQTRDRVEKYHAQLESFLETMDFRQLHTYKQTLETALHANNTIPPETLKELIPLLNSISALAQNTDRFQDTEIHAQQEHVNVELFSLCEEKEDGDGIREFAILAQSEDKEGLQKLLQAKIEKDEYGYIASNGIDDHSLTYFRTNYASGFVSYYIIEEKILTRYDIEALLQTPAYDTTFHGPQNLWAIVQEALNTYASENGYHGLLAEPVITALKSDKQFHAYLIQEGWAAGKWISDGSKLHAIHDIHYYFDNLLDGRPDYFIETGGLSPAPIPDNLRSMLIDSVYRVARDHQLPVTDAASLADKVLLDPNFQSFCRETYTDIVHLTDGTALHQTAINICYDSMKKFMLSELPETRHPSFHEQVKRANEIKDVQRISHPVPDQSDLQKTNKDTRPIL